MALSHETLAQRIKDAMARAGLTQQELARAVDMEPTALSKALSGRRGFKLVEVALIAEHLQVPTDVLLADDGIEAPRPALAARTEGAVSAVAKTAVTRAERIHDVDQLLNDLGYPDPSSMSLPLPAPGADPIRQGERLADAARQLAGSSDANLPTEPDDLAAWVEDAFGVDVCMTALPSGLDGLAVSSGRLRLALVSSSVAATRQRFTIAHEMCHLACGDGVELTLDEDVFGRHTAEEQRANAFAAAFLMPAAALREATRDQPVEEQLVIELLDRFRVSLDALAFRLHNIGAVSASGRDAIRAMSSVRIATRPGRLDDLQARNDQRVPGRLLARAMQAFAAGDIGVYPLAALLDTDAERLLDELSPPRFTTRGPGDAQAPAYAL